MKIIPTIIVCAVSALFSFEPHFMKDPAVSPDGSTICFSYANDLWSVPFSGGTAKRLTSVKGDDSNPDYSPDGRYIAFNSDRDGSYAVYIIPANGGVAKRVVTGDYSVVDWFADSENLLLTKHVQFTGSKMFKINIKGYGLTDLNKIGYLYADLSKENDKMVFAQNGEPYRERMTGSQNGRLFICDLKNNTYSKIADSPLTERYPVYSKTGKGIYFARSDGELFQIYLLPGSEIGKEDPKLDKITNFDKWSARDISIAYDNDRMAYEYFDGIWTTDPSTGASGKLNIEISEDHLGTDEVDDNISSADKFFPSAKGNWVLFKSRFDLFAVPVEGGEVKRITGDNPGIEDFVVMKDNETVYFTA
ncbi:MAG TPA: hypothetical protein PLK90_11040, partial [Clostridiales bacterium]|nr:hypothetical protein [Clostridiales bacterium]HQP70923.1 hypothetical protein [Clostridiales bacterium]